MNYLKSCLFVINMFKKLDDSEKNINKINEDLSILLFEKNEYSNFITSSLFDAKSYSNYLEESNFFLNPEKIFMIFKFEYLNQFKGLGFNFFKEKNFPKFCLNKIKQKVDILSINIDNSKNVDDEYYSIINMNIQICMQEMNKELKKVDQKIIKEISNYLYQIKNNLKDMKWYKYSYCEGFFKSIYDKIIESQEYKKKEYIEKIRKNIEFFDIFFRQDISKRTIEEEMKLKEEKNIIHDNLSKIIDSYNYERSFTNLINEIKDYFEEKNNNLEELLKKENNDINQIINNISIDLQKYFQIFQDDFDKRFKEFRDKLENFIENIKKKVNDLIKLEGTNENITNVTMDELLNIKLIQSSFFQSLGTEYQNYSTIATSIIASIYGFIIFGAFGLLSGGVPILFRFIKSLFTSKEQKLKEKLNQVSEKLIENITSKERLFHISFNEMTKKTINNLKKYLALALDRLNIDKEEEWNKYKEQYKNSIKLLYTNQEAEIEEKKEEEKIEEKKEEEEIENKENEFIEEKNEKENN